jgi:hypothetical protein
VAEWKRRGPARFNSPGSNPGPGLRRPSPAAPCQDRIDALRVLFRPIDSESVRTYVEKVLVRTLKPGDIVIIDNLESHNGEVVAS